MAEAIQTHLHCMVNILLVNAFPGKQTHDLVVASIKCYVMPIVEPSKQIAVPFGTTSEHRNYVFYLILGHRYGR